MADKNRGALNLLATYGSTDDSSDEDVPGPRVSTKRTASKEWSDSENRKVLCTKAEKVYVIHGVQDFKDMLLQ